MHDLQNPARSSFLLNTMRSIATSPFEIGLILGAIVGGLGAALFAASEDQYALDSEQAQGLLLTDRSDALVTRARQAASAAVAQVQATLQNQDLTRI